MGLALLFFAAAWAEFQLPESNYVLIENKKHPERSRLLVMDDGQYEVRPSAEPISVAQNDEQQAVVLAMSVNSKDRLRGLTLLAGNDSFAALETALVLMADHDAHVREEALQILFEHPKADRQLVIQLGRDDASSVVRKATAELIEEASGD